MGKILYKVFGYWEAHATLISNKSSVPIFRYALKKKNPIKYLFTWNLWGVRNVHPKVLEPQGNKVRVGSQISQLSCKTFFQTLYRYAKIEFSHPSTSLF